MTDEKDNSDSDWEHLQTMSEEETPPTENNDIIENENDESGNNPNEKEEGEPPQEENAKVEEKEPPPTETANADEDSPPQDDSSKAEENNLSQYNPIKEEEQSHDDSDKEEESEPPEDDLVKAKQSTTPPENHPIPGKSYMIQTRNKPNLILVLKYGKLEWLDRPIPSGGHIWRCVKKDGWLGFRNMASGTYLGYNKEGKIVATQKEHKEQQSFTESRKENGGYMLSVRQEAALVGVAFSEDGKSMVLQKGDGEALDFIDSKYLDSPVSLKYPNMPAQKLR